jgi:hypothetical protein
MPDQKQTDYQPVPFVPLPPQPMTHGNPDKPAVVTPQTTPSRQAEQATGERVGEAMRQAGITPDHG